MNKNLKDKTQPELKEILSQYTTKTYLHKYIFSFIHDKKISNIEDITPLGKDLRNQLINDGWYISCLKTIEIFADPDGTKKYLFELEDHSRIESVLLTTDTERKTLCISCQSGCRMGCEFCATGKLKFKRNLTAGEIVDQVIQVSSLTGKIHNIVYMGMGEPFDNYDETIKSAHILMDQSGLNIGQRHITISTCGLTEGIRKFAGENTQVRLAISLHSPDDAARCRIMPIANKWPIKDLFDAIHFYQDTTGRRVMFEYCMIKDLNDSDRDAGKLIKLISSINAGINLIEYNPHPGCDFQPSSRNRIMQFKDILQKVGIETIVRYKRGQKINAACGQLGSDWYE